ncbi:nicotianamine synthase family protein [Paenibacillus soyae]|uniref:SAM-dependent methyltransferase n=1 Tax=Paenibacillus soyae TaxID=2969249 RepID=A0A9X2SAR1_9BACL|nr:nicotianamine synthase family protein [Paenibacillus soyae]MCR2806586.1 SAM-dependent methyltransferase [Paenibacillus soyae]
MITIDNIKLKMIEYCDKFEQLSRACEPSDQYGVELEVLLNDFSHFVTKEANKEAWEELDAQEELNDLSCTIERIRATSAACVAMMEKHRAIRLRSGNAEIADYFRNIEACIETEFGSFSVAPESKVLLIGSGAFPMTPLLIARRTGAEVVGIDIDEDAVALGREVVAKLGEGLNIRLEHASAEHFAYTGEATHIIFSSTVGLKYELLDQLHALTVPHVVVAMRYGNGLKSLFNYPMREIDGAKWRLTERILRADQVFDVALYTKTAGEEG